MAAGIEIIDAQVHLNQLGTDWRTAPADSVIATAVEAMDAVGIDRVLIGEARGSSSITAALAWLPCERASCR